MHLPIAQPSLQWINRSGHPTKIPPKTGFFSHFLSGRYVVVPFFLQRKWESSRCLKIWQSIWWKQHQLTNFGDEKVSYHIFFLLAIESLIPGGGCIYFDPANSREWMFYRKKFTRRKSKTWLIVSSHSDYNIYKFIREKKKTTGR